MRVTCVLVWASAVACSRQEPPTSAPPVPVPSSIKAKPLVSPAPSSTAEATPRVSLPQPSPDEYTPEAPRGIVNLNTAPVGKSIAASASPVFTIESFQPGAVVLMNNTEVGTTPLRWSITSTTQFDPTLASTEWPPPGSRLAAKGRVYTDEGAWSSMEVWILGKNLPGENSAEPGSMGFNLAVDEYALFITADLGANRVRGALRLRLPGHRYVAFMPTEVTPESAVFQRYSRALWFERER